MMIKQKIIDHHGRVENIRLYDKDPTFYIKEAEEIAKQKLKDEEKAAKRAAAGEKEKVEENEEGKEDEDDANKPPPYKTFDNSSTTLFEIFG